MKQRNEFVMMFLFILAAVLLMIFGKSCSPFITAKDDFQMFWVSDLDQDGIQNVINILYARDGKPSIILVYDVKYEKYVGRAEAIKDGWKFYPLHGKPYKTKTNLNDMLPKEIPKQEGKSVPRSSNSA